MESPQRIQVVIPNTDLDTDIDDDFDYEDEEVDSIDNQVVDDDEEDEELPDLSWKTGDMEDETKLYKSFRSSRDDEMVKGS